MASRPIPPRISTKIAEAEIRRKIAWLIEKQESLEIEYDLSISPPSFGDFFLACILRSWLQNISIKCEISFGMTPSVRRDWPYALREELIAEFRHMDVSIGGPISSSDADLISWYDLMWKLDGLHFPRLFYQSTAQLLALLWKYYPEGLPIISPRGNQGLDTDSGPYITLAVRRSAWDATRDSTDFWLQEDIKQLLESFPAHRLVLLGEPAGLIWALETIGDSSLEGLRQKLNCGEILPQRINGFIGAVDEIAGAQFHFQRRAGGTGVVPFFCETPTRVLNESVGAWWYSPRGHFIGFPWATKEQTMLVGEDVADQPLSKFL